MTDFDAAVVETRRAYEEAGGKEGDWSPVDAGYFSSFEELSDSERTAIPDDAEYDDTARPESTEQWAYFWHQVHNPIFTGGPGTLVYYMDGCSSQKLKELQWGRQLTGSRCSNGDAIWKIYIRAWVGNP